VKPKETTVPTEVAPLDKFSIPVNLWCEKPNHNCFVGAAIHNRSRTVGTNHAILRFLARTSAHQTKWRASRVVAADHALRCSLVIRRPHGVFVWCLTFRGSSPTDTALCGLRSGLKLFSPHANSRENTMKDRTPAIAGKSLRSTISC
jgi:hypothetical protein